jgi:hypothetical protein
LWERSTSSHDHLYQINRDKYPELRDRRYVKVEITPKDNNYVYPEKPWNFTVDEERLPDWFTDEHKLAALRSHRAWKKEVYAIINLAEAQKPIHPLHIKPKKVAQKDIDNLRQWDSIKNSIWSFSIWDSVRDSVGEGIANSIWGSVWDNIGNSIRDSVGDSFDVTDSVRAYIGSLCDIWNGDYKYQCVVDLWTRGFVLSYEGKTWQLHAGKDAHVVYTLGNSFTERQT